MPHIDPLPKGTLFMQNGSPMRFHLFVDPALPKSAGFTRGQTAKLSEDIESEGGMVELDITKPVSIVVVKNQFTKSLPLTCTRHGPYVVGPSWIGTSIKDRTIRFPARVPTGGIDPLRSNGKKPFTDDEKQRMCTHLAWATPMGPASRTGTKLWREMVALTGPEYAWTRNHTWQSWQEQYRKHAAVYDSMIAALVKGILRDDPNAFDDGKTLYSRAKRARVTREEGTDSETSDAPRKPSVFRPLKRGKGPAVAATLRDEPASRVPRAIPAQPPVAQTKRTSTMVHRPSIVAPPPNAFAGPSSIHPPSGNFLMNKAAREGPSTAPVPNEAAHNTTNPRYLPASPAVQPAPFWRWTDSPGRSISFMGSQDIIELSQQSVEDEDEASYQADDVQPAEVGENISGDELGEEMGDDAILFDTEGNSTTDFRVEEESSDDEGSEDETESDVEMRRTLKARMRNYLARLDA